MENGCPGFGALDGRCNLDGRARYRRFGAALGLVLSSAVRLSTMSDVRRRARGARARVRVRVRVLAGWGRRCRFFT